MNHYARLGLTRDADGRAVARAFRRIAREAHPDRGGDTAQFHALEEAYRVLSDPRRRRAYDIELDGSAPDWDDVAWGVEVSPPPRATAGTDADADGAPDDGLAWGDVGWGDDVTGDGVERPHVLDPLVGGPVGLPDPLTPPAAVVPLDREGLDEWVAALGGLALAVVAFATRIVAVRSLPADVVFSDSNGPVTSPLVSLIWVASSAALHTRGPRASGGTTLAWSFTVVAALMWVVDLDPLAGAPAFWVSTVAGFAMVAASVVWARLYRRRRNHPERLAALQRRDVTWRIDRHHRAEEWNRVRAALQVPGRRALLVGPVATDPYGRPLPGRRWTLDPQDGTQKVRTIGDVSPQGSWVVVDARDGVVARAPSWAPEAWLDAVQE